MIFDLLNKDGLTFEIHYHNIPAMLLFKTLRKIKNVVKFHSYVCGEVLKEEKEDNSKKEEELVTKVKRLTEKITSRPNKPKPAVLHALTSISQTQEFTVVFFFFFFLEMGIVYLN